MSLEWGAAAVWGLQIFTALFLGITFLQSGLDKFFNTQANLDWLQSHFAKSVLAKQVTPMFWALTLLESAAGLLLCLGILQKIYMGSTLLGQWGVLLTLLSLCALLFGKRLAKDYAGAAALTGYFIIALFATMAWGLPSFLVG